MPTLPTLTLLDRDTSEDHDLVATAKAHLLEAEEHAGRAAASAAQAAEHYGTLAGRAAQRAADTVGERMSETASTLREDAEEIWNDPEDRRFLLQLGGGIAVVGLVVWLWRRRKRRKAEQRLQYEASSQGVPGWDDPRTALTDADADEVSVS